MILVIIDDHIDDADPAVQCFGRTNEEIVLIEYFQHIIFELFGKTVPFQDNAHCYLTGTIDE